MKWWGCSAVVLAVALPSLCRAEDQASPDLDVETYVQIVRRAHPSARLASGLEAAARAEQRARWLIADPQVEYSRGRAQAAEAPTTRATETGLSLSQTIPWPGAYAAGVRAGARAAEALRAGGTDARWELEVAARRAFARLVAARARLDLDRATEEDARSLRDLVARRTELGETRESDRIKAAVEWMGLRRLLAASQREAETAEALVRTLAVEPLPRPLALRTEARGELPAQDPRACRRGDKNPQALSPDPASLVAQLLERNPQLLAAHAEAERQKALASQASQSRLPDLDVSVFRERELDKSATGIALGLKVPLWNGNRGEVARARAARDVAAAEAERKRLELLAELEERIKDLEVARAQAQTLEEEILPAAQESLRLARRSYEEGETSLLELLDAQRTFRDTQREAVESRLALALAVTDIQRLVGPDFDPWR